MENSNLPARADSLLPTPKSDSETALFAAGARLEGLHDSVSTAASSLADYKEHQSASLDVSLQALEIAGAIPAECRRPQHKSLGSATSDGDEPALIQSRHRLQEFARRLACGHSADALAGASRGGSVIGLLGESVVKVGDGWDLM